MGLYTEAAIRNLGILYPISSRVTMFFEYFPGFIDFLSNL